MIRYTSLKFLLMAFLMVSFFSSIHAQDTKNLEGRWDLVVQKDGKELPSWLEIRHSGTSTLVGRFVYAFGSARPISEVKVTAGTFSFSIPPQWELKGVDMSFEGSLQGDKLKGTMIYTDGKSYTWTGTRTPNLPHTKNPKWGKAIKVFNGKDLSGWHADGTNQWEVKSGILTSAKSGANLISDQKFMNFKLHAEFRYQKDGNSGIYLRGRHEVQIADNKGLEPSDIYFGGVYGFLTPNEMVAKDAGEWQTFDITLIGNRVTIVANGAEIITDQIIPGITGGALDSRQGEPGSFYIQGDHGPVEFRSFVVTPMVN